MTATVIIATEAERQKAMRWLSKAPRNTRVTFRAAKRSVPQNARLWAMLTDVAMQLPWHGVKLTPEDWKLLFMDALKHELRLAPNLNGNGFVNLGRSSSTLSKEEFSDLMELISSFGASHGVEFAA